MNTKDIQIKHLQEQCQTMSEAHVKAVKELDKFKKFVHWCLVDIMDAHDIDSCDAQEKLAELGLMKKEMKTERCGEHCACAEMTDFPVECFRVNF